MHCYVNLTRNSPLEGLASLASAAAFVSLAVLAVRSAAIEVVDVSRVRFGDAHANVVGARLLDLVPGRSGAAYAEWLNVRNETFRAGIEVASLDSFRGYKNALDDELEDRHRRPRCLSCRQTRDRCPR